MCQQDSLHKSMIDNPLGFIIFYVFAIVFVALLFQLSKKISALRGKKNSFFLGKIFYTNLNTFIINFLNN